MLYSASAGLDVVFGFLLIPVWLLATVLIGRLPAVKSTRRLRVAGRITQGLIWFGAALTLGRIAALAVTASLGWVFVDDRRPVTVLAILVPTVAVLVATLPRLRRIIQHSAREPREVPDEVRASAAEPWLAVPVQAAAIGTLPGLLQNFLPPYQSFLPLLLAVAVLEAALIGLLVPRARRRAARLTGSAPRLPAIRVWAVRAGVLFAIFAMIFTLAQIGSRLSVHPETFSMAHGVPDFGGGEPFDHQPGVATGGHGGHGQSVSGGGTISVDDLSGPRSGTPDRRFTLTAQAKQVRFSSGTTFDAWTFNGQVPGPELRVREGDLVEVTLVNELPDTPVTIHWHGVDVPNGEDGVAGVTQDAVQPGQSYTYRFRAEEVGSRWYHSHQQASEQVQRGLFGPLVIEPREQTRPVDEDVSVVIHDWETEQGTITTMGTSDTLRRKAIEPGAVVRARLMNTSSFTKNLSVTGVPYRVVAYDGTEVNRPQEISGQTLELAGAGRYDIEFTMPSSPVRVTDEDNPDAGLLFSPDGNGELEPRLDGPEFDPIHYGQPAATPFDAESDFDRHFTQVFDQWLGFYNGSFALRMTVNGEVFPNVPMHMVREGELIKMTFINRGQEDHPMHVHGHHVLVLSRNGERPSGSPIWLDTVNVQPGEIVEIGFVADNPGIWMDHCHNFTHTKLGMVLHLAYAGVTSPYQVGGKAGNHPA